MSRENAPETSNLSGQVVSLCLFRFSRLTNRFWAFGQMALARAPLRRLAGLNFFKLMGAGTGEGFTPIPDLGAVAVLCVWNDRETAERHLASAPVFARYRAHASETFTILLSARSARGAWSGQAPFTPIDGPHPGPIVALTRATLRPAVLLRFWSHVPDISRAIAADPRVMFKAGVGEVPWFHQMTFSIWPDAVSMAAFARQDGPHARAIRAVRENGWFREELYARFSILRAEGTWRGVDPLLSLHSLKAAE